MLPKVVFQYSFIYDQRWKFVAENDPHRKRLQKSYPSSRQIAQYLREITPIWKKIEKKVLRTLVEKSGLKWKRKTISCYVVGFCKPFSDPLTLRPYKNQSDFIDILIHELIHNLIAVDNKRESYFRYLERKYRQETKLTINHIPVNAILTATYLQLFGEKRLKKIIAFDSRSPDYKRAWEIAEKEGLEKIVKE